MTSSLYCQYL